MSGPSSGALVIIYPVANTCPKDGANNGTGDGGDNTCRKHGKTDHRTQGSTARATGCGVVSIAR